MKKFTYAFIVAVIITIFAVSTVFAGYTISASLWVGQSIVKAGFVKIWNDADNLYVEYQMRAGWGWCLKEAHVHVAQTLDDFPINGGGNAIPGQFDYKVELDPCVAGYTFTIPLGDLERGAEFYIAAHAVAYNKWTGAEETGWAVRCGDLESVQFSDESGWTAYIVFTKDAWNVY